LYPPSFLFPHFPPAAPGADPGVTGPAPGPSKDNEPKTNSRLTRAPRELDKRIPCRRGRRAQCWRPRKRAKSALSGANEGGCTPETETRTSWSLRWGAAPQLNRMRRRHRSRATGSRRATDSRRRATGSLHRASCIRRRATGLRRRATGLRRRAMDLRRRATGLRRRAMGLRSRATGRRTATGSRRRAMDSRRRRRTGVGLVPVRPVLPVPPTVARITKKNNITAMVHRMAITAMVCNRMAMGVMATGDRPP